MEKIKLKISVDQLIVIEHLLKEGEISNCKTVSEKSEASILIQVYKKMSKRKIDRIGKSSSKKDIKFNFEYYEAAILQDFCGKNLDFFNDDYMNHQIFKTSNELNELIA